MNATAHAQNKQRDYSDFKHMEDDEDLELGKPKPLAGDHSAFSETSSMTLPVSPRNTYHLPRRVERRTDMTVRSTRDMQEDYELRLAYDMEEPAPPPQRQHRR